MWRTDSKNTWPKSCSLRGWGRSEAAGREPVSAQLSYNKAGSSMGNQTNSKDEIELLCYRGGVALINHWLRSGLEADPAVPRRSNLNKTQRYFYLTSTVHNASCTTTWSKHRLHSLPGVRTGTQHHASRCQMPSERAIMSRLSLEDGLSVGLLTDQKRWGPFSAGSCNTKCLSGCCLSCLSISDKGIVSAFNPHPSSVLLQTGIERAQNTSCIYHHRGLTASGISCFYFHFQTLASCYWCIIFSKEPLHRRPRGAVQRLAIKEAFSTLFHNSNKTCLLSSYFAEEIQATHKNSWIFLRAISPTFVHIFKENNNLPLRWEVRTTDHLIFIFF